MRNAVTKASSSRPAPKNIANVCSRTRPRTRLKNTAALTMPARRASCVRPADSAGRGSAVAADTLPSASIPDPGR